MLLFGPKAYDKRSIGLGKYRSETTAKKVLMEIVNHYYNFELTKVYEMPDE